MTDFARHTRASQEETQLFVNLAIRHLRVLSCGKGNCTDKETKRARNAAWDSIVDSLNSSPQPTQRWKKESVIRLWRNVICRVKRRNRAAPMQEPEFVSLKNALAELEKSRGQPKKKRPTAKSAPPALEAETEAPEQSQEESDVEIQDTSSASSAQAPGPPTTEAQIAAQYSLRTLYVTLSPADIAIFPRLERETSADTQRVQGDKSSNDSLYETFRCTRATTFLMNQRASEAHGTPKVQPDSTSMVYSTSMIQTESKVLATSKARKTSMGPPTSVVQPATTSMVYSTTMVQSDSKVHTTSKAHTASKVRKTLNARKTSVRTPSSKGNSTSLAQSATTSMVYSTAMVQSDSKVHTTSKVHKASKVRKTSRSRKTSMRTPTLKGHPTPSVQPATTSVLYSTPMVQSDSKVHTTSKVPSDSEVCTPTSKVHSRSTGLQTSVVHPSSTILPSSMSQPNTMFPSNETRMVEWPNGTEAIDVALGGTPKMSAQPRLTEAVTDKDKAASGEATQAQLNATVPVGRKELITLSHSIKVNEQLKARQEQVLSEMEKYIHEMKLLAEATLKGWAKEHQDTRAMAASASFDKSASIEEQQQERDAELHAAKMRNEELHSRMLRELHEVRMHTAKAELDQAEVNKRILEVKLQQAMIELENSRRPA